MSDSIRIGNSEVHVIAVGDRWRLSIHGRVGMPDPRFREAPAASRVETLETLRVFLKLRYLVDETPLVVEAGGKEYHGILADLRGRLDLRKFETAKG